MELPEIKILYVHNAITKDKALELTQKYSTLDKKAASRLINEWKITYGH